MLLNEKTSVMAFIAIIQMQGENTHDVGNKKAEGR